jgi:predicted metalloprotease with PDZ domain
MRTDTTTALAWASAGLLFAAGALAAEPTRYRVRYAGHDQFQVEASFAQPTTRLDLNSHESKARPKAQAESIRELQAFDAAGKPVPIEFVGQGGWELKHGAAARIRYRVIADHDAADWIAGKDEVATKFDHSYFFASDAFFLVDYDAPKEPIEVRFDLPRDWLVTAPWPQREGAYVAPNPDDFGTNAFAMGRDAPSHAQAGSLQLTWLSDSRVKSIEPRLLPMFDKLPAAYTDFWGGSPGEALTVFFLSDPDTDGGAFHNSFALRLATPLRPSERLVWEHTLGHELMHVWMNNSNDGVRLAGGGATYWFTEGFTDYLTVKLMHEAGLIDDALLRQRLANQIRRYQFGRRLSPGVSLVAAGKEKHKHWELVYGGGALFALMLDAELSSEVSPTAFRDALRRVQHQGAVTLDAPALLKVLDEASAGRATAIMQRLDAGLAMPELRAALAPAGLAVEGFATDEVYVDFASCAAPHEGNCVPQFLAPD